MNCHHEPTEPRSKNSIATATTEGQHRVQYLVLGVLVVQATSDAYIQRALSHPTIIHAHIKCQKGR
jgi:hypothetical protein